jgi:hypothetical protein
MECNRLGWNQQFSNRTPVRDTDPLAIVQTPLGYREVFCCDLFNPVWIFFFEARMLTNLDLLIENGASVMNDPLFLNNHRLIQAGLVLEAFVFASLIAVSVLKPRFIKPIHRH